MVVPALIYFMVAQGTPEIYSGWAIPMATDIAFAIGIVALLGKRVPLPQGVNFAQIFAIAILCGIGFTMSMFLAGLAFGETAYNSFDTLSRLGILLGSGVSAVVGYLLLRKTTSQP